MNALNLHEIRRLRGLGWSWSRISGAFGLHHETIRRLVDPDFAEKMNEKKRKRRAEEELFGKVFGPNELNLQIGYGPRPSQDILAQRDYRLSFPYRDLTGELMGDPRRGQSALDRKVSA